MPIASDNPLVSPAVEQKTFDLWWMCSLLVQAENPNQTARVLANLKRYRRNADGSGELTGETVAFDIPDLFALAASDPETAQLIDQLVTKVGALAKQAGKIQ